MWQLGRIIRGTDFLKTWGEKVAHVMSSDDGKRYWFSHDKIRTLIAEYDGVCKSQIMYSLSPILLRMLRKGYLERAIKPASVPRGTFTGATEYIYRLTDKHYTRLDHDLPSPYGAKYKDRLTMGRELYRLHPRLPRWYRRMMM